jgi:hypothetical protein
MADEAPEVNELAEVPASEQAATTAPATEGNLPEENTSDATQEKPPRLFTQEEVDDFLGKRIKTIQKRLEREQARKAQQAPLLSAEPPVPEQFDSTEAYAQALATRKAEELRRPEPDIGFATRVENDRVRIGRVACGIRVGCQRRCGACGISVELAANQRVAVGSKKLNLW